MTDYLYFYYGRVEEVHNADDKAVCYVQSPDGNKFLVQVKDGLKIKEKDIVVIRRILLQLNPFVSKDEIFSVLEKGKLYDDTRSMIKTNEDKKSNAQESMRYVG